MEEEDDEEEIIDFDEDEDEVSKQKKKRPLDKGLLPTIGFEESGERIFKLSELVMPHSSSQRKYLMDINRRIIESPGNLKLIDTILYPDKSFRKLQKKKQDFQKALD